MGNLQKVCDDISDLKEDIIDVKEKCLNIKSEVFSTPKRRCKNNNRFTTKNFGFK